MFCDKELFSLLIFAYLFCPKNNTTYSRKTSITQEWLVVEICLTPRWIVILMLYWLMYNIRSHFFNELILTWSTKSSHFVALNVPDIKGVIKYLNIWFIFLTAIWLPHCQLWATNPNNNTTSLTPWKSIRFICVWLEGLRDPRNEVGSQSHAERLVQFEPGSFQFSA